MSISTEITRITADRNTIRTKLIDLGLADSTANLDTLATAVDGIVNRGAVSATIQEGDTYTIPAGYHNGSGTVQGVGGGGHYELQAKTATPTKSQQSISPDSGYYGLSSVTVGAIPAAYQDVTSVDATASDVLANKIIVEADGTVTTGTMPNNGAVSATLDTTTTSYTVPAGYHSGLGSVSVVLEQKSVTPTTSAQTITPTSGKVLSSVAVSAIPANFGDATGKTVTDANLLYGITAIGIDNGSAVTVTGAMTNNGAVTATIDGTTTTSYTIPAGYHNGSGTISLDNTIETLLAAI